MLTLKKIFAKHQGVTSVIFDEVDTGVSGRVAQSMGEKIYHISNDSQVLCITHLPQVAAMADTHIRIDKIDQDERSEEHTSELQSRGHLVCRLLLEKKKQDVYIFKSEVETRVGGVLDKLNMREVAIKEGYTKR